LELNGRLGQASSDQEGPAPHEFAGRFLELSLASGLCFTFHFLSDTFMPLATAAGSPNSPKSGSTFQYF
jgi:hypothetical protein